MAGVERGYAGECEGRRHADAAACAALLLLPHPAVRATQLVSAGRGARHRYDEGEPRIDSSQGLDLLASSLNPWEKLVTAVNVCLENTWLEAVTHSTLAECQASPPIGGDRRVVAAG